MVVFAVLDAFGRLPEGITQGGNVDLGMFDQCLNIMQKLDGVDIKGKYCYGGLMIPLFSISPNVSEVEQTVNNFVCVFVVLNNLA